MLLSLRMLVGLVLAGLAAGGVKLVSALFAIGGLSAVMERAPALLPIAATQTLLFAVPFSLPIAIWAAVVGIRSWGFHAGAGLAVAAAALATQYVGEGPAATIANPYAILTFASAGLVGGTVYWLAVTRNRPSKRRHGSSA